MIIPASEGALQVVFYWHPRRGSAPPTRSSTPSAGASAVASAVASPAAKLYERFCAGTDAFRNARFKLIPSVAEAAAHQAGRQLAPRRGKTLRLRFFENLPS